MVNRLPPESARSVAQPAPPDRTFGEVENAKSSRRLWRTEEAPQAPDLGDFGPLKHLCGEWVAEGTGWNMIALPFQDAPAPPSGHKYRILMNQYNEKLNFFFVDDGVKNRGLKRAAQECPPEQSPGAQDFDQVVATIDYQQAIRQIEVDDFPASTVRGGRNLAIHQEPGLWLYEKNLRTKDDDFSPKDDVQPQVVLKVARLASIPHGNSVLAIGTATEYDGMPDIPAVSGLPTGRFENVRTPDYDFRDAKQPDEYLEPYKHYIDAPFKGTEASNPAFPGFSPADMNELLRLANVGVKIVKTTVLDVDTTRKTGGIRNLPFSVREAEPISMKSTFWIQELEGTDDKGEPMLRLQYSQVVMLQFFRPREDELPGMAVWPHISICTLMKVQNPKSSDVVAA